MDSALDDLIDTLGGPEETNEENTTYTGPVVSVCDLPSVEIYGQ
jgi:calpastatin